VRSGGGASCDLRLCEPEKFEQHHAKDGSSGENSCHFYIENASQFQVTELTDKFPSQVLSCYQCTSRPMDFFLFDSLSITI